MTHIKGNVIHADFGRQEPSVSVRVTNDILYLDDQVMLARCSVRLNGQVSTTHFLAHRAGESVEIVPVHV